MLNAKEPKCSNLTNSVRCPHLCYVDLKTQLFCNNRSHICTEYAYPLCQEIAPVFQNDMHLAKKLLIENLELTVFNFMSQHVSN